MARRIVITDSGFWKYSWAHLVMSMTVSCRWVMQCRLRARRPRASNKGLRPCPLRAEISPVSLNLLMMLCTVDDEICKAFAIWRWRTLFLKYSIIFLHTFSQIGEPRPICIFFLRGQWRDDRKVLGWREGSGISKGPRGGNRTWVAVSSCAMCRCSNHEAICADNPFLIMRVSASLRHPFYS